MSSAYVVVIYLAALLKHEAFFSEAFPILLRNLTGIRCNDESLGDKGRRVGRSVGLLYCLILPA
jgi:hypothetical protein